MKGFMEWGRVRRGECIALSEIAGVNFLQPGKTRKLCGLIGPFCRRRACIVVKKRKSAGGWLIKILGKKEKSNYMIDKC